MTATGGSAERAGLGISARHEPSSPPRILTCRTGAGPRYRLRFPAPLARAVLESGITEPAGFRQLAMLLLHLSDLHFRAGVTGTALDPDLHLRNELLRDAETMCTRFGELPAAILLSGDIAFAADPHEYEFARWWLADLCRRCGVPLSCVFTSPGNHDVVRSVTGRRTIQALHRDIKNAGDFSQDALISGLLRDPEAQRLLYESLNPYNAFAAQFLCDLLPPERTIARRDLTLNDRSVLRLSGLNSTFLSSASDEQGSLYVDPSCRQISREAGVEHLVMSHHGYRWLHQGDLLRDHLNSVARLHLFGHEHVDRIEVGRDWVRVAAGAAHPERQERTWEPGYNFIQLNVQGTGLDRHLDVSVHVRVWQQRPDQFRAKMDRESDAFSISIKLDPWEAPLVTDPPRELIGQVTRGDAEVDSPESAQLRNDSMTQLREVSVRFFRLTLSQKSAIAGKLGLMEEDDANQPDFERFRRALLRARDRQLMEALEQEIESIETA